MKFKLVILTLFFFQIVTAQYTNTDVVAKIKTQTIGDIIAVVGTATNTTEVNKSLKYIVSVFKTNINNNISKNKQEGRFTLEANEGKELSKGVINVDETSKIVVLLLIYEEDVIIGKDRLVFNEGATNKQLQKEESSTEDGIELKGIVIEETKTKPGRDFYEFFFNMYSNNQINGSKVVGIYEKLSFGRSTIIQVKIEDSVIHEFLGKPDLEYLEHMSKVSIRKVYKYFKDLKKQKNNIFQY
ncbi:CsgE family curli-type amyloid fiber assembly protein [Aquimarina sp. I32.4]|uniref:CsgE family curli-type amyloid fiber assembly protein n=1 Tax=Aquimarina sp. I32.4 TaxID=2053903 RepID=UPI000CDE7754|nr:CsgE family curli-type amyloid fiber assembly protein [Aquimarina sp. I32.4]